MKRIIILSIVLRLLGIYLFRNVDNYDVQSYIQVGTLTLKHINVYPKVANLHHPYFPVFLYIEAFAFWLGRLGGLGRLGIIIILKVIINLFDFGNLYLVYLLSNRNLKSALLYVINPVSFLIFTLHGQFDAIPLFLLLLAVYLIKTKKTVASILVFSMSVAIKTWPLLFITGFYKRIKNKKLILLTSVFPLMFIVIYSILFKSSIFSILKTILNYQGLWGIWGLSSVLEFFFNFGRFQQKIITGVFLISFFVFYYFFKKISHIKEILFFLLFFLIFTTNFSIQYFSWLMPFLVIVKPKNYWLVTMAITEYLVLSYLSWRFTSINQSILIVSGLILWLYLASIFWMAYRKKYSIRTF
ncbi:hypothetical protein HZA76_04715 [Candidatus Roizmanbacteria bacterium]|nr:hypothetical protein [Candidatus Roizmanbacteria bacterium]